MHLAKDYAGAPTQQGIYQSPHKRSSDDCYSPVNSPDGVGPHSQVSMRPVFSPSSEGASTQKLSPQLLALSELEFRKGFLILSYIGSNKLEDFMSADDVSNLKNLPMWSFEEKVWDDYGEQIKHCSDKDRPKASDGLSSMTTHELEDVLRQLLDRHSFTAVRTSSLSFACSGPCHEEDDW
ncbi:hypothetical protein CsSME_00022867 [Camellia sinensis var. sinensis]